MADVFDLIFNMFGQVVKWLDSIPVFDNVTMFDFSIAVLIMSIVIVAFVPVVSVGATSSSLGDSVNNVKFKRQTKRDIKRVSKEHKKMVEERGY